MTASPEVAQAEVAVVGAGPAGLSAALAAAEAGAQVTLIDNYRQPGGQYYRQPATELQAIQLTNHQREGRILWQKVAAAGVDSLTETTVWGAFAGNQLALHGPQAPPSIEAQALILATGAYERPAAFPGWTLPGVMMAGAAQTLLKGQRILPGRRIVLAGTGPLQLVLAAELVRAGAEVVAVLEGSSLFRGALRHPLRYGFALWGQWPRLAEGLNSWLTLRRAGVPLRTGWGIVAAHGRNEVTEVTIAQLNEQWRPLSGASQTLSCDTLCLGYGFVPATELAQLLGVHHKWRAEQGGFVPVRDEHMQTNVSGVYVVGDGAGIGGAALAQVEGQIAGLAAAAQVQAKRQQTTTAVSQNLKRLSADLRREQRFQQLYGELFTPGPGLDELSRPDTVICRCEEITQGQIHEAVRKGADTLHAIKALTRCGMGNCQGRVCGPLVTTLVARELGQTQAQIGQFRVRRPVFPVPLSVLHPTDANTQPVEEFSR